MDFLADERLLFFIFTAAGILVGGWQVWRMEQEKRHIKSYMNSEIPLEQKPANRKENYLEVLLIRADMELDYPLLISVTMALSVLSYFIGFSITGNPKLSLIFIILGPFLMWQYITWRIDKNEQTMYKQVGELAKLMSNSVRANLTVEAALPIVAKKLEQPIKQYIVEAARQCTLGKPLLDALVDAKKYIRAEPYNLFIRATAVAKRKGGDLSESYNDIYKTINKSMNAREKVNVVNKSAVRRGLIVTGIPVVMIIVMRSIAPEYMEPLFTTLPGYILLSVVVLMIISAWAIIRKMCRVELM